MASIYKKALKRKDFSGVVKKEEKDDSYEGVARKKNKKKVKKVESDKHRATGADIGVSCQVVVSSDFVYFLIDGTDQPVFFG